jgi:Na+/melibiose symporter-like transporter
MSLSALAAFAAPGFPVGALAIALSVFLPQYYAHHFGIELAVVGGAFGFVRIVDTAFDPMIGLVMDRTHTRLGRYRPYLFAAAPLLVISVYMLFAPVVKPTPTYMIVWLFAYYIGASLLVLAHAAWASGLARTYHERSRVFGVIQVVSVLGSACVLLIPLVMDHLPQGRDAAVPAMGWFVVGAIPICIALATARTPERVVRDHDGERVSLGEYWRMVSRPDMRRIIVADFCLMMGPGWMSALYLFYFRIARGFTTAQASIFLLLYIFTGIIGAGVISKVAQRFGKHRTQMACCVLYSLGLSSLLILPSTMFAICTFMLLLGLVSQGFNLLDRAMVADVGDAIRLESGKHRVGLLYAMITTVQKIASALAITVSFAILAAIGFSAKADLANTPAAIAGLKLVYLVGPISFVMLGAACYIGYKLDDKAHGEIREALERRDAGAAAQAAE